VSAVTFPAYEQTSINARSVESGQASLENAREALENARKVEELRKAIIERCKK
jgi:phage head maturation protease